MGKPNKFAVMRANRQARERLSAARPVYRVPEEYEELRLSLLPASITRVEVRRRRSLLGRALDWTMGLG